VAALVLSNITESFGQNIVDLAASTIINILRLLASFGEVGSLSTSLWEIEKFLPRNDAAFPPLL